MQFSPYQTDILKAVQQRVDAPEKKGLIVEALAGSGKSTRIWLICQQLQAQGYTPKEVVAVVFGRKNKEDLQKKVEQKVGSDWGVVVRTLHSLCYGIYRDALNVSHSRVSNENNKYSKIAQEFGFFSVKDDQRDTPGTLLDGAIFSEKDFTDLLDRLRLYCLDANRENVNYLVELYKLGIKDIELVAAAAEYCLSEGLKVATNQRYWIDMTDMIWVPWAMRDSSRFKVALAGKREQLKFLLLDEAQDTDLLQIEMLSLLIHPAQSFLTAVGDRNQAVYFFRGALNDGMDRIQKRFQGENFALPVCYRCGTKHLDLVREVFPSIPIQPRTNAPAGEIRVVLNRDFPKIFDDEHLSYMGVCRKNAPLIKAAIQLLAAGKPAKIKDKNIGGRLVTRVKDICQKQRVKYNPDTFIRVSVEYEEAQRKRLHDFPNSENQINDLVDMLEAIRALFQAYEPGTFKAWERIVEKIFDESGYSPISLYTIHSGKGGEGQVSFIIYPEDLPLEHPKQVEEEREQEDHLLYVALTRTLADGADGSGILYLVCRESSSEDDEDKEHRVKVNYPKWLPKKYRQLWKWDKSNQLTSDEDGTIEVEEQAAEAEISSYTQLEQEIREYFKATGLKEPKLSQAYEGVVKVASGTMGRDDIDERLKLFFSPTHRPAVKTFATKLCDLREAELIATRGEQQVIEAHLEQQRSALGMNRDDYEFEGEVQITPNKVLVKGKYRNSKIYEYTRVQGIPEWAAGLPVLYYPGCTTPKLEPETVNVFSEETAEQPDAIASKATPENIETSAPPQKQWFNTFTNQDRELTRTNAEKRNQVKLLLQYPEWQILSDRAIADHCNVSAPFVGKVRAELATDGTVNLFSERVDRKGRRLDTSKIGTKPKSAPQPAVAKEAIAPQVTATKPQKETSTVGVLEAAFRKDQEQEQARINRATQIKAEIVSLRDRLVALEAELAAL